VRSGFRSPFPGRRFDPARSNYRSGYGQHHDGGRDHDRDRHGHRHPYNRSFGYGYPAWYGYSYYPYPYVIDPGLYDWSTGDTDDTQGNYTYAPNSDAGADAGPDYPSDPGPLAGNAYAEAPPASSIPRRPNPVSAASEEEPLTVFFKDGRNPEKMRNYILNSRSLTDLDRNHYQQIPLDQIDVAATEQANRAHGLDFEVPGTSRE